MRPMIRGARADKTCDPAPSRWAWRFQRLLLTPAFILFLRAGVPMLLAFAAGTWWLSDETRRATLVDTVVEAKARFETRPEFMVHLMAIDGATDALAQEIRAEVLLEFPLSSFELDLGAIRDRVMTLDPVKTATVRIRPGGVLQVDVERRRPVIIWRDHAGLSLVDAEGFTVRGLSRRMNRPDLPLIAGQGATDHVPEALDIYKAAAPLGDRLRGVVRVGDRRWDVVLDRDQRILLPEDGAVEALERVIALDGAQDILSRDIQRVDLRLGARPTVQMSEYATDEWWNIRQISGQ
ncbi:MAG: cell division protein FtsQ/DivIB [Roseobacter sp.]